MSTIPPSGVSAENYYQRLFEAAPFGVLIADNLGHYIDANPEACRMLGLSRAELLSKRVFDFVTPPTVVSTVRQWSKFREDSHQSGEFQLRRLDGQIRILRYQAVADLWPGVHVSYLEDVTPRPN